jgi:hypothetical protein
VYEVQFKDPTDKRTPKTSEENMGTDFMDQKLLELAEDDRKVSDNGTSKVPEKPKQNKTIKETPLQKMRGILFWKHNPENNEKYLKKELTQRCGEAINGKKLSVSWLEDFNIGNIMHLSAMSYSKMIEQAKLSDFLNKEFIIEIILVYTCV